MAESNFFEAHQRNTILVVSAGHSEDRRCAWPGPVGNMFPIVQPALDLDCLYLLASPERTKSISLPSFLLVSGIRSCDIRWIWPGSAMILGAAFVMIREAHWALQP